MKTESITREYIHTVYCNRRDGLYKNLKQQHDEILKDFSSRRMLSSGQHLVERCNANNRILLKGLQETILTLASDYRTRQKDDPEFFWNLVKDVLFEEGSLTERALQQTLISDIRRYQLGTLENRVSELMGTHWRATIGLNIREQLLRSEFFHIKSPYERKKYGIPDVAVMMWFPEKSSTQGTAAIERYNAIKEAAKIASNDQAVVNKFDDPNIVSQDRISASIEEWLKRSAVVVVDLCGNRQNVYYEFSCARTEGTDLIATCPEGELDNVHLHIKQWPLLLYKDTEDLKQQLTVKMRELFANHSFQGNI